ncbi:MAG TPA: sigma-70 family RNA polymerase sigma factor [Candidatus Acidoferrum sp.]|nr:sigma-70 family RNA polymerase sigma factor [Candidatus Acidoferrum sp.]
MGTIATARLRHLTAAQTQEVRPTAGVSLPTQGCDETLVTRVQTGDQEALSSLFRRYAVAVRNVGRRILRDDSEADDLVQEVFLYIHRRSVLFDAEKGSARSWIFQVAYTQAFLRRRQLKSQGFYTSVIADNLREIEPPTSSGADYDQTVEGLFGRNGWRKILESLTEEQRETLRLHFFEGCTFAEIAEQLGQSYANVRNHYYRGLERVRKHLAETVLNWR